MTTRLTVAQAVISFLKNHFYREGRLTEEQAGVLEGCLLPRSSSLAGRLMPF